MKHRRLAAVQIHERVAKLVGPTEHGRLVQKPSVAAHFGYNFEQVLAGHKIHYQVVTLVNREKIAHLGQAGVVQSGQG